MGWPSPAMTRWLGGPDRPIVEDGLTLPIHRMASRLPEGVGYRISGTWQWSIDGEPFATIGYRISRQSEDRARLDLNFRCNGEPVEQIVWLSRAPCRFGGGRWYAECPHTARRVSNLHLPNGGRRFLSRMAYRLGYRSQCEGPAGRAAQQRHKLARRMDIDPECPIKPKRMRWRTFERTVKLLNRHEEAWAIAVHSWLTQRLP